MTEVAKYEPVVSVVAGKTTTTSMNVASVFGKKHKNVIRDIQNLQVPKEFTGLNFEPSEYIDPTGRTLPMYQITRDGFTILAMGFTGEKAMKFKLAYIEAFNRMEAKLKAEAAPKLQAPDDRSLELRKAQAQGARKVLALVQAANQTSLPVAVVGRVCHFRKSGLTQGETAKACDLSPSAIQRIEITLKEAGIRLASVRRVERDANYLKSFEDILSEDVSNPSVPVQNVRRFIEEECIFEPDSATRTSMLYRIYKRWSFDKYHSYLGRNSFMRIIEKEFGIKVDLRGTQRINHFVGIGLRNNPSYQNRVSVGESEVPHENA